MSGKTLVDLGLEHLANRKKYIENIWSYLSRIKKLCLELDPTCRVLVFGSFIKGCFRPDSDIDVLIITEQAENPIDRGKLFRSIVREIGLDNPFEFHIITHKEYRDTYKKFIDTYREV
ncbi:MAG: nucleotidyltransferase domain-containing protein [Thermoprotei archaeon]